MCAEDRCYKLQKRYGITLDWYREKLRDQNFKCAICNVDQAIVDRTFPIDHDHKTNAVRDILCTHCNLMLGHAHERPERLRAAADYLERHKEGGETNANSGKPEHCRDSE